MGFAGRLPSTISRQHPGRGNNCSPLKNPTGSSQDAEPYLTRFLRSAESAEGHHAERAPWSGRGASGGMGGGAPRCGGVGGLIFLALGLGLIFFALGFITTICAGCVAGSVERAMNRLGGFGGVARGDPGGDPR